VKNVMLAVLAVAVIVLGVLLLRQARFTGGGGGGAKHARADENNLTHVKCNSKNPDHPGNGVEILVNSSVGLDYPDKITFGCKDEQVHWKIADSGVKTFTVTFIDWPFSSSQQSLQPDATTGLTPDQPVKHINAKYEIDAYTLVVTKSDGSTITADPHFIPMGP
jgi:hypothetical protein